MITRAKCAFKQALKMHYVHNKWIFSHFKIKHKASVMQVMFFTTDSHSCFIRDSVY